MLRVKSPLCALDFPTTAFYLQMHLAKWRIPSFPKKNWIVSRFNSLQTLQSRENCCRWRHLCALIWSDQIYMVIIWTLCDCEFSLSTSMLNLDNLVTMHWAYIGQRCVFICVRRTVEFSYVFWSGWVVWSIFGWSFAWIHLVMPSLRDWGDLMNGSQVQGSSTKRIVPLGPQALGYPCIWFVLFLSSSLPVWPLTPYLSQELVRLSDQVAYYINGGPYRSRRCPSWCMYSIWCRTG